jgi:hypothetical protein
VIGQRGQRGLQAYQESRVCQAGRQDSLQVSDPRALIGQVVRGGALSLVSQASVVFRFITLQVSDLRALIGQLAERELCDWL